MGTFHSFISQPLYKKEDAELLLADVLKVCDDSDKVSVMEIRGLYVVVGIVKNLGGAPFELNAITHEADWATVSDEKDFLNTYD